MSKFNLLLHFGSNNPFAAVDGLQTTVQISEFTSVISLKLWIMKISSIHPSYIHFYHPNFQWMNDDSMNLFKLFQNEPEQTKRELFCVIGLPFPAIFTSSQSALRPNDSLLLESPHNIKTEAQLEPIDLLYLPLKFAGFSFPKEKATDSESKIPPLTLSKDSISTDEHIQSTDDNFNSFFHKSVFRWRFSGLNLETLSDSILIGKLGPQLDYSSGPHHLLPSPFSESNYPNYVPSWISKTSLTSDSLARSKFQIFSKAKQPFSLGSLNKIQSPVYPVLSIPNIEYFQPLEKQPELEESHNQTSKKFQSQSSSFLRKWDSKTEKSTSLVIPFSKCKIIPFVKRIRTFKKPN